MRFEEPQALLLLPAVAAAAALCWFTFRWKDRTLALFARGETMPSLVASVSRGRQRAKVVLGLMALVLLVVGLAKPFWGETTRGAAPQQADILLVMDVSLSMAATDVRPSRLEQAKAQALALVDRLQGDRIGLVVFAGAPSLRFPLTYDYGAARSLIRAVEPDSAPSPGSALADGILTAVRALRQSDAPVRAVFLLSDGEDLGSQITMAVQEAVAEGVAVSTLGAGTFQGGTIPVRGPGGTMTLKRDRSGQIVQTRLDAGALESLAEKTGGRYALATDNGRELVALYQRVQQQLNSRVSEQQSVAEDLGSWFVVGGVLLLMVEMLLPERRGARRRPNTAAVLPLVAVLFAGACTGDSGPIFKMNEEGAKFFKEGNFPAALDRFRQAQVRRPDLPPLTFNVGGALYKTQEFDRALRETQRVLDSDDAGLRARANFNMGNAYFKKEQYQDAFDAYKRALKDNPLDLDAKINLELTLRRLEERQQQQSPPGQTPGQDSPPPGGQSPPQPQPPGNNPPGPPGQPSDNTQPGPAQPDPSAELRRALRDAGQEVDIEDALRILDALRLKEQQMQDRFNRQPPGRGPAQRPDKDW